MSNLSKNLYIINDSLYTAGFGFLGFYNFSNGLYQEVKFPGQIYDIKKFRDKIYIAADRTLYTLNENMERVDSLSFDYTIGAIGVMDDVIIVGSLGKTLDFVRDGVIFETYEFGNGGIIDIETNSQFAYVASRDGSIRQFYSSGEEFCFLQKPKSVSEINLVDNTIHYGTRDGFIGSFNPCQYEHASDSLLCYIEQNYGIMTVEKNFETIDSFFEKYNTDEKVEIWNLSGELIFNGYLRADELPSNGIYLIRIGNVTKSMVIIH